MLHPTLLAEGRAVGTWKSKWQKNHLQVQVEPFGQLAPEVSAGVEAEVTGPDRVRVAPGVQPLRTSER